MAIVWLALGLALGQGVLVGLARALGRRLGWLPSIAALANVFLLLGPWLSGSLSLAPLEPVMAKNLPGLVITQGDDPHGVYNDVVLELLPWEREVRAQLAAHRLPFWSDLLDGGSSPWMNPQTAVLAPLATLARLAPFEHDLLVHTALKLLVAWQGAYLLAGAFGCRRRTALLAGISFATSGGMIAWALFPLAAVVAWTPWLVLATLRVARGRSLRGFAVCTAVTGGLLLSGHPEAALAAFGVAALVALAFQRRKSGRRLALVGSALLAGTALAAPVLLPFALAAQGSLRAARTAERAESPPAWRLLLAPLGPRVFGRPFGPESAPPAEAPVAASFYAGCTVLAGLGLVGVARGARRKFALLWLGMGVVYLGLSAGIHPPRALLAALPLGNALAFNRFAPAAVLCLVLAASIALDGAARRRPRLRSLAFSGCLLALGAALHPEPWAIGIAAGVAVALALFFHRPRLFAIPLLLVCLLDLVSWSRDVLPRSDARLLFPRTPLIDFVAAAVEGSTRWRAAATGKLLYPALLPAYDISDPRVNNPAAPATQLRALDVALGFRPEAERYKGALLRPAHPLLDFLAVRVLIAGEVVVPPPGMERLDQGQFGRLRVYRNSEALPLWFCTQRLEARDQASLLDGLRDLPDARTALVDRHQAGSLLASLTPSTRACGEVRSVIGPPGNQRIELQPGGRALLVAAVPFSAGWRARGADGGALSTLPVDTAFLGIDVPADTTEVRVRFRPPGLLLGLLLSLAGTIVAVLAALRRQPSSPLAHYRRSARLAAPPTVR